MGCWFVGSAWWDASPSNATSTRPVTASAPSPSRSAVRSPATTRPSSSPSGRKPSSGSQPRWARSRRSLSSAADAIPLICPAPPRPRRPTRRPRAPRRFPRSVRPTPTARPATPAGSISAEPGSVSSTVRVYTAAASPARQSSRTGARAMTATPSWATRASTAPRIISANRTPSASDRSQGEGRRTSERERRACR